MSESLETTKTTGKLIMCLCPSFRHADVSVRIFSFSTAHSYLTTHSFKSEKVKRVQQSGTEFPNGRIDSTVDDPSPVLARRKDYVIALRARVCRIYSSFFQSPIEIPGVGSNIDEIRGRQNRQGRRLVFSNNGPED